MKKTLLIITLIATVAITFFACSEREHSNPLDSEYWSGKAVDPVSTFSRTDPNPSIDMIKLNWAYNSTSTPGGYKFRIDKKVDAGEWAERYRIFDPNATTYTDTAEINRTISYRICITFDENISEYKTLSYTNTFPPPSNLQTVQTSITSANLTWNDNSIGEDKFEIERKLSTESTYTKIAEVTGSDTTTKSWSDSTTIPNLTYDYRVKALKGTDESIYNEKTNYINTFQAPTGLTATQNNVYTFTLNWTDNSNGEDGFKVERKIDDGAYSVIATVTGTSYVDSSVSKGFGTVFYQVRAYKGTTYFSSYSQVNSTVSFPAPTDLIVTQTSITIANLSWTDNSIGEEKFEIERKLSTESTYSMIGLVAGSDTTTKSWSDSTTIPNLTYEYRVRAIEGTNNTAYITSSLDNTFPAPSNLNLEVISDSSIKLDWTDNSNGEDGFIIDRKVGSTGTWVSNYVTVSSNIKTFTDIGLTIGTAYYYRVRGYYSTYYSSYTSEISVIPADPEGFVSMPTGSFSMGQDDVAMPVHTVNITRQYYLGKYEVTQKEWETTMGTNPATDYGVGDNYPVYKVSWYAILVYCNKRSIAEWLTPCYTISGSKDPEIWGSIPTSSNTTWDAVTCDFNAKGYRLPTEAEWEYGARYNDSRTYPWGEIAPSSSLCNYNSNVGATTAVGSYPSGNSNLGVCDMAGNVWEWVWDWYDAYPSTTQTDPTGPTSAQYYRVLRGGSWGVYDYFVRCAARNDGYPNSGVSTYGCRLARTK